MLNQTSIKVNENFLHIANALNDHYPSPDITADAAWTDMQKLLDEDDDNTILPPPIPPTGGNNGYWKYGLLLLLIAGIAVYYVSNKNKIQQMSTVRNTANSNEQKVGEQVNGSEQTTRNNNAIKENDSSNLTESLSRQQPRSKYDSLEIILPGAVSKNNQVIETGAELVYKKNNTASPRPKENGTIKNKKYTTGANVRIKIGRGSVGENNIITVPEEINRKKREPNVSKKLTGTGALANASERNSKQLKTSGNDNQKMLEDSLSVDAEKTSGSNTANKPGEPSVHNDSTVPVLSASNTKDSIKDRQLVANKPEKLKTDTAPKINNGKRRKKIT